VSSTWFCLPGHRALYVIDAKKQEGVTLALASVKSSINGYPERVADMRLKVTDKCKINAQ
jgi:hypothetical protein